MNKNRKTKPRVTNATKAALRELARMEDVAIMLYAHGAVPITAKSSNARR